MKVGDLIKVQYRDGVNDLNDWEWSDPYHGVIFETPDMGPYCLWKMFCIERGAEHVFTPHRDKVEIVVEAKIEK
jgi:hypothetical protein